MKILLIISCLVFTPVVTSCVERAETPMVNSVIDTPDGKFRQPTKEEMKGLDSGHEDYWGYGDRRYCKQRGEC